MFKQHLHTMFFVCLKNDAIHNLKVNRATFFHYVAPVLRDVVLSRVGLAQRLKPVNVMR